MLGSNPDFFAGYLIWSDVDDESAEWMVNFHKIDAEGNASSNILTSIPSTNNFLFVPDSIREIDYKVVLKLNNGSGFIEVDSFKYQNDTSSSHQLGTWYCNGPYYAYNLTLYEFNNLGWAFYIESGRLFVGGVRTPFYMYLTSSNFEDWRVSSAKAIAHCANESNYERFHSVKSYPHPGGGFVNGNIVAVIKPDFPYHDIPFVTNIFHSIPTYWQNQSYFTHAMQTFNTYSSKTYQTRPDLECIPQNPAFHNLGNVGPLNNLPPITSTHVDFVYSHNPWRVKINGVHSGNVDHILFNYFHDLNPEHLFEEDTIFGFAMFQDFILHRLDKKMEQKVVYPNEIFLENGIIEYPNWELEDGLYSFKVRDTADNYLQWFFEYQNVESSETPVTLASLTDINVYPNPLTENLLNFSIESEQNLNVQYRIVGCDGVVRKSKWLLNTHEIGQNFYEELENLQLQNCNYFLIQFIFEDDSFQTKTI